MSTGITEETKVLLRDWARSKSAIAALWLFGSRARGDHRTDSDYDIALELKSKEGDHDWAFGDYVFLVDDWKSEIKALINSETSLVAFRDDLQGRFDPRDQGIKLWPEFES
jgi:predicted nucleotidyltransferase